ncbi:MAG: hypothetical protein U0031_23540 [Thermomicrobiales bacterium]|mgnify:CR=1 FL=1
MTHRSFDRFAPILSGVAHRRTTILTALGGIAAAVTGTGMLPEETTAKKRRCRNRLQSCGGKKKCCDSGGPNACREYPGTNCPALTGKKCCGLEGARCTRQDPPGVHCECCDDLFCNLEGRCQSEPT